jgi:hypothetical protein
LTGGISVYSYGLNDPLSYIDTIGLDALVVIGGQRSDSYNIFGHSSVATTGSGIYSFGTGTKLGGPVSDFVTDQSRFRNQTLYTIKTTPEQDKKIQEYLSKQKDDIGKIDNCAARTLEALRAAGIDPMGDLMKIDPDAYPIVITPGYVGLMMNGVPGAQIYNIPKNGAIPDLSQFNK